MATYIELINLRQDSDLPNRLSLAVVVEAYNISQQSTPADESVAWAQRVIQNPRGEGDKALLLLLAANKDLTVAQIQGASDSSIQSQVASIVSTLAKGLTPGS